MSSRRLLTVFLGFGLGLALWSMTAADCPAQADGLPPDPAAAPKPDAPIGGFGFGAPKDEQVIAIDSGFSRPNPDGSALLFITATMKKGWHIYSITQVTPPTGGPLASKIKLDASDSYRLAGTFQSAPAPEKKIEPIFDNLVVETHDDSVKWSVPIQLSAGVNPETLKITGQVNAQACDPNSCLPPKDYTFLAGLKKDVAWTPPVVEAAKSATGSAAGPPVTVASSVDLHELAVELWFAFLGGLILNLMPCVLPVISLKLLSFLDQAGESRGRVLSLNIWYSIGLISVFLVLGALAATVKQAWGEQFTLPWFKVGLTGLVFAMALSFLGVWEIPIPGFMGTGRANELQAKEGASGAFFKGVFATLLATPCSGPFLAPVFGYVLTQPAAVAYGVFGAIGLGMASPYLVVGAFPELLRFLPRPGAWMETFRQIMAFLLLGTVVYLFTTLKPTYFVPTLTFLVGLWFAAWLIGRTPITAAPQTRMMAWVAAIGSAALVGTLAFTLLLVEPKLAWQPFSPNAVAQARQEGKTVMIDFSANWCLTCKANLKFSVETDEVRKLVDRNGVVTLLADWTDRSPAIKDAINQLGYNSIPLLVIYPAGSRPDEKPIVLPDLITESRVLAALEQAGPSRGEPPR